MKSFFSTLVERVTSSVGVIYFILLFRVNTNPTKMQHVSRWIQNAEQTKHVNKWAPFSNRNEWVLVRTFMCTSNPVLCSLMHKQPHLTSSWSKSHPDTLCLCSLSPPVCTVAYYTYIIFGWASETEMQRCETLGLYTWTFYKRRILFYVIAVYMWKQSSEREILRALNPALRYTFFYSMLHKHHFKIWHDRFSKTFMSLNKIAAFSRSAVFGNG